MENTGNISVPVVSLGQKSRAPLPIKRASADSVPLQKPKSTEGAVEQTLAKAEVRRLQRLHEAANSYAVSDQRFTIYKDATGQYITRFTSLRDGKVTYFPEPALLTNSQYKPASDPSLSLKI